MLSCTLYLTTIFVIAVIPWTGATHAETGAHEESPHSSLCKDARVTDKTLDHLRNEEKKCMDEYEKAVHKYHDEFDHECIKHSKDYTNANVKSIQNQLLLWGECSTQYWECDESSYGKEETEMNEHEKLLHQQFEKTMTHYHECREKAFNSAFPKKAK